MSGSPTHVAFGLSEIFTFFFLMLGPIKILGPFAKLTAKNSDAERRALAFRGISIAALTVVAASFIGHGMLVKWKVSEGALSVAGGIMFFLVAISAVLEPYTASRPADAPQTELPPSQLVFRRLVPIIVSPYGIAAVIFVLTLMPNSTLPIVGMLLLIMALDLGAMLLAHRILGLLGVPLQILGTIMGVLQVALSVQMIVLGVRLIAAQTFGFRPHI